MHEIWHKKPKTPEQSLSGTAREWLYYGSATALLWLYYGSRMDVCRYAADGADSWSGGDVGIKA